MSSVAIFQYFLFCVVFTECVPVLDIKTLKIPKLLRFPYKYKEFYNIIWVKVMVLYR